MFVWLYLLRKGAYRDFLHIILKAHTISNKLVIKVIAQKKGGEVMTATNTCSNFGSKWSSSPLSKHTWVAVIVVDVIKLTNIAFNLNGEKTARAIINRTNDPCSVLLLGS